MTRKEKALSGAKEARMDGSVWRTADGRPTTEEDDGAHEVRVRVWAESLEDGPIAAADLKGRPVMLTPEEQEAFWDDAVEDTASRWDEEWQDARAKHTPGPWTVSPDPELREPDAESVWADFDGVGAEIAGRICEPANARLIAAAPELLRAAVVAQSWLEGAIEDGTHADRARADLEIIRAAIAKARGGK